MFFLNNGPISWKSKLQPTVALSSCESEYIAATQATKETVWIQRLLASLEKLGLAESTEIKCNNQGAIHLAANPTHHERSKHVNIQYHYVREKIEDGKINLEYIPTTTMAVDGLTKLLGKTKWGHFIEQLGLTRAGKDQVGV